MAQIYPDEGLIPMLLAIVDNAGEGLTWALYENDVQPDLDSVLSDFTLSDPTWGQAILDAADFTNSLVNLHIGTLQAPNIKFKNTTAATVTVYGYVVFNQVGNVLIAANRFEAAPVTLVVNATQTVTAIIGDYSEVLTDIIDGGTF